MRFLATALSVLLLASSSVSGTRVIDSLKAKVLNPVEGNVPLPDGSLARPSSHNAGHCPTELYHDHRTDPNTKDIFEVKAAIIQKFGLVPSYGLLCNFQPPTVTCPLGDNLGAMVRLVFHDAAGGRRVDRPSNGMNGCIDFSEGDNNGLQDVVAKYDEIYKQFHERISRADLWALGATLAINFASRVSYNSDGSIAPANQEGISLDRISGPTYKEGLQIPFVYGRKDEPKCNDRGLLPSADSNWPTMFKLFNGRFDMNTQDIVAIMGSHALGRVQAKNSGIVDGEWINLTTSLTNLYYSSLGAAFAPWTIVQDKPVWFSTFGSLMLGVDVELVYQNSVPVPAKRNPGCPFFNSFVHDPALPANQCVANTLKLDHNSLRLDTPNAYVQSFAGSQETWYKAYLVSYTKMTTAGYSFGELKHVDIFRN